MEKGKPTPAVFLPALLLSLALLGCPGTNPTRSSITPGTYVGSMSSGETCIIVVSSSAVTRIRMPLSYSSGTGSLTQATLDMTGSWPIENGSFQAKSSVNGIALTVSGAFDGKTGLSGSAVLEGKGNYSWSASLNGSSTTVPANLEAPTITANNEDGASALVGLSSSMSGAKIYYTILDADITVADGGRKLYAAPFLVSRNCTLKAIAVSGSTSSPVSEKVFDFADGNSSLGSGAWIKTIGTKGADEAVDLLPASGGGVVLSGGSCVMGVDAGGLASPIADLRKFDSYQGLVAGPDGRAFYWRENYSNPPQTPGTLDLACVRAGSELWKKSLGYGFPNYNEAMAFTAESLLPLSDGSLALGMIENGKPGILFIDADGNKGSYKRLESESFTTKVERILELQKVKHNGEDRLILLAMLAKESPVLWNGVRSYLLVETTMAGEFVRAVRIDSGLSDVPTYFKSRGRWFANDDGSGALFIGQGCANGGAVYSALIKLDGGWASATAQGIGYEGAVAARSGDGGYLVAVERRRNDLGAEDKDLGLMKFAPDLGLLWAKSWGGVHSDDLPSAILERDGYIYLAGKTFSYGHGYLLGPDFPDNHTTSDIWLLKTATDGSSPKSSPAHGRYGEDFSPSLPTMTSPTLSSVTLGAVDASAAIPAGSSSVELPTITTGDFLYANQYPAGS